MKKVRKEDLRELIGELYREFILGISTDEYYKERCEGTNEANEHINIRPTHVQLWWYEEEEEIDTDTKNMIENFAQILEKISFGNLKMIFYGMDKINNNDAICIYIANAYEVIE